MDLDHLHAFDDRKDELFSSSSSTVYDDEIEKELLLLSDTEEKEEERSRFLKRKMAVTRRSYRSKESSQRQKTREVYIQLKKQYLAARMYGGYEGKKTFFLCTSFISLPLRLLVSLSLFSSLVPSVCGVYTR